ncbi:MAG: hypothetical protein KC478_07040, partial [Bacteriovoracaceae bacterium]|nr:hypothetical protein [Bacteriovoracaceae bacterium]
TFNGTREKLPFKVALGASYKLNYVPLKWYLTIDNLQQWDISVPNPSEQSTDLEGNTTSEKIGFFHLTDNKEHIAKAQELFKKHESKKHFVQVGIGGSALGPQALIDALQSDKSRKFSFMDNTDAEYIADVLSEIDPKESLFYIVSKSGGTAETIACFSIARNFLRDNGIAESELKNHFVFCTDPDSGQLKELAQKEGYECLQVPSNIGGRFSVLTHVGLFPALFAGISIEELYEGANDIKSELLNENVEENILLQTAAHMMELYESASPCVNQTVLMPYSSKLKTLSNWFVQLWGESLGKVKDGTNVGLTPIPAYGATDQHSQMQLFMEGPSDKVLILLETKNKATDYKLNSSIDMDSARKLENFSLNQLIEAQFNGTLKALSDQKKNVIHMSIEQNDARHFGALALLFESLTALMGEYMEIDAFNQPGVELGKKYAYEYLKNLN